MLDYRTMFDSDYLFAFHLQGREVTLKIARVESGLVKGEKGKKDRKPVVYFAGKEKGLALNKTNGKTIAGLYGNDTAQWIGKLVTLYPTTTEFGRETVDCIRIRPGVPRGKESPSDAIDESKEQP